MSITQTTSIKKVITAASLGTLIEWYDFYIFGSLAVIIGKQLFPADAGASALINTLAIFAAGFIVRPFGALVFGRLGDLIGRKYTFLLTLVLMGGSTFMIGLIPGFSSIGYFAPVLVLLLRLIQGLALGGEYGGAATYVAEHAPENKKGFYTSWIQTTATLGLFLSLGVIVFLKTFLGTEKFEAWGWRIPFLISIVLVFISFYIRQKMNESPMFVQLKKEGKTSTNPLKESFRNKGNLKIVLLALFGAVMGQGVIWYTGQFYAQSFLENTCRIEFNESRYILLWAIALATPFFIVFGSLSDRFGRKWIMLGGMFLAVIFYRPIYQNFLDNSNITSLSSSTSILNTIKVNSDNPMLNTENTQLSNGYSFTKMTETVSSKNSPVIKYSNIRLPSKTFTWFVFLVFVQILFVTMVYGPIAAFLVDLFPTKIRYTSMSLPYHIGNGVFGGLVPFLATLITSFKGTDALSGLWYPIAVASVCFVIGLIYLDNKKTDLTLLEN
jgi:MFS family permease